MSGSCFIMKWKLALTRDAMRFGTFHLMTQYPGATGGQIVAETLAEAELAERLGFDRVWLTEHHASDHGICSAPAVFASVQTQASRFERARSSSTSMPLVSITTQPR